MTASECVLCVFALMLWGYIICDVLEELAP